MGCGVNSREISAQDDEVLVPTLDTTQGISTKSRGRSQPPNSRKERKAKVNLIISLVIRIP